MYSAVLHVHCCDPQPVGMASGHESNSAIEIILPRSRAILAMTSDDEYTSVSTVLSMYGQWHL